MMMMMILTLFKCTSTKTLYIAAFTSSSSCRYSLVKSLPTNPLRQQQQQQQQHRAKSQMFHLRSERYANVVTARKQFPAGLSSPLKRHRTLNTMLFSSNTYYPFLNVALDQPLYQNTPIRQYFTDNLLLRPVTVALKSVMGFLPMLLHSFQNLALSNTAMTVRLIKYAFLCFTLFMCSKYIWKNTDRLTSVAASTRTVPSSTARTTTATTKAKEVVPMPFDPNINEGWSICKLQSIVPYGSKGSQKFLKPTAASPYLLLTMALPQSNYVLPLQLGQTIHICGLDRNGNARPAEFHPFVDPTGPQRPGTFTLLVPNPSRYRDNSMTAIESDGTSDDNHSHSNDLQQLRVVHLLQDYMTTGDTEIAIHPGITSKLQYRGSHYPVTEIIYFVIGSTGIVPVLDQVSTVLTSSSATAQPGSGVERVSMVWITSCIEEFETFSSALKQMYETYSTQLAVSCGVETSLQSSMTQEIASDYFFETNVEINDSIPTFQPGMAAIISIEGLPHTSTSLLRQGAVKYLERQRGFPTDCICIL